MDLVKTLALAALIAMGLNLFTTTSKSPEKQKVSAAGFSPILAAPDFEPIPEPIVEPAESIIPQDCKDGICPVPSGSVSSINPLPPAVSAVAPIPVIYESKPVSSSVITTYQSDPVVVSSSSVVTYSAPIVSYRAVADDCASYAQPVRTPVRNVVRQVCSLPVRILEARPVRTAVSRVVQAQPVRSVVRFVLPRR